MYPPLQDYYELISVYCEICHSDPQSNALNPNTEKHNYFYSKSFISKEQSGTQPRKQVLAVFSLVQAFLR